MDYKERQKEFKRRLENQVKMIWVSKAFLPKYLQKKGKTYIKSVHGLIGSKAI